MNGDEKTQGMVDLEALAEAVESMRELVNTVVAGFKADGFTDYQARRLAVWALTNGQDPVDLADMPGEGE